MKESSRLLILTGHPDLWPKTENEEKMPYIWALGVLLGTDIENFLNNRISKCFLRLIRIGEI